MATSRYLPRVAALVLAVTLVLTGLLVWVKSGSEDGEGQVLGYEARLFDPSRVHTIELVMDDWEDFIEGCESEEYSLCAAVIDGESYKNIAIRAKGNTSLSSVSALNSERYSFKIEFDHYDETKTYHGLDKLNLNNLIFDNTMMKDYLTYQMMGEFGVDAPLCSYVYVTVNGEDFGLYLAVEGVEDAFLTRNYSGTGELYKPDSMNFGGGRGNGQGFDMAEFDFENFSLDKETITKLAEKFGIDVEAAAEQFGIDLDNFDFSSLDLSQFAGRKMSTSGGQFTEKPEESAGDAGDDALRQSPGTPPGAGAAELEADARQTPGTAPGMDFGGGMGGMGSSDVKLQYIDENVDSYSNIFDNAKTEVTEADAARLIEALRKLSAGENLEDVLDMEEVLRYFVVHSFVVNGDSYTGSMIHNYYLYERDGKLAMIPWDYNLAFGTFQGGDASSAVNDAIDEVLSDRPMQSWIFSDEAYTAQYHALYAEFLETMDMGAMIEEAYALIAPYVEKDPTKFCTEDEFEAGVAALKQFCALRKQSVAGQLDGTIPSTEAAQRENSAALVETEGLVLSEMGTMTNGGGMGGFDRAEMGERPELPENAGDEMPEGTEVPQRPEGEGSEMPEGMEVPQMPEGEGSEMPEGMEVPQRPEGEGGEMPEGMEVPQRPEGEGGEMPEGMEVPQMPEGEGSEMPEGMEVPQRPGGDTQADTEPSSQRHEIGAANGFTRPGTEATGGNATAWVLVAVSIGVLLAAIVVAKKVRR